MNTIYTQFQQALKREKQYITTYYDNIQYPCLYRKVDDYKNTSNHIEIFYDITTPIKQGQLLIRDGKVFIVINKESVENDTYYKSIIKKCNLTIPVVIGGVLKQIPCYSYELSSAYNISNNIIRFVDGKGELITELIPELSNSVYINTGLRIMGGYFDVVNTYDIDGIVHIMLEKNVMPADTYSLILTSDATSYIEGETSQLVALAMVNDNVEDTTATIIYSSSDETIATVDDNGLVTFVGVGDVTITATWVEQSLTKTLGFTVVVDPDAPAYIFTLTCSSSKNEITVGGLARYITAELTDSNGNEVDFVPVWTFDFGVMKESDFTITDTNTKKISIKVASNYDYVGKTFTITCTTSDGLYTENIDILIMV